MMAFVTAEEKKELLKKSIDKMTDEQVDSSLVDIFMCYMSAGEHLRQVLSAIPVLGIERFVRLICIVRAFENAGMSVNHILYLMCEDDIDLTDDEKKRAVIEGKQLLKDLSTGKKDLMEVLR